MTRLIFIVAFLFVVITIEAQDTTKPTKTVENREFKNQGEQEDYWARKLFENEYERHEYKKFRGEIIRKDTNTYELKSQVLEVFNMNEELKLIFSEGIFYPSLIVLIDRVRITDLEELTFLSNSPKTKRYRFWLSIKNFVNPQVYFIELTNPTADKTTGNADFIKGATLTFLKSAWIVI